MGSALQRVTPNRPGANERISIRPIPSVATMMMRENQQISAVPSDTDWSCSSKDETRAAVRNSGRRASTGPDATSWATDSTSSRPTSLGVRDGGYGCPRRWSVPTIVVLRTRLPIVRTVESPTQLRSRESQPLLNDCGWNFILAPCAVAARLSRCAIAARRWLARRP